MSSPPSADDDDVKQLVIVDNTEQQELARKLRSQNRPFLIKDFEGPLISLRSIDRGAFWRTFDKKTWRSSAMLRRRSVDDLAVVVHVLP